ncbi:hypothetical protein HPP92_012743 [Vanilla planifolia]|uniref:Uncharacterized protein n=1 Tax=Vanilla planifolia TaxID=51239 RepID=A0A835QY20_VANPL|nr:hypothetical protein HPP92_012743 [Vanilla planifolia]
MSVMVLFLCSGPCVSYMLRKRALYNDMSRYVCCAGYLPCSGKCGESKCPEFCLCTEVFLCFGNSVASTRFLLQDEFNIQTTQCDNCIIGFMFLLQQFACIFSIVAAIVGSQELSDASQIVSCLSDFVYWTVCACMQTQHKIELDKRDGKFGPPAMAVPAFQQMSRFDQPVPPSVAQPYGYPPPGSPSSLLLIRGRCGGDEEGESRCCWSPERLRDVMRYFLRQIDRLVGDEEGRGLLLVEDLKAN